jgi:hypothetical protein
MRKKRQRPRGREPFPGAGYCLDLSENIQAGDFDIVEKRLEEISARYEQIEHLMLLKEHFEHEIGRNVDKIFPPGTAPITADPEILEQIAQVRMFRDRLNHQLEHLRNLEEIENQKSGEAPRTERGEKEAEDEPAGPQWNNGALAVAIYALLRACGLSENPNKTAVARFAGKLTGRSGQNLRTALYDAIGGTFREKTAADVAEQFDKMGLPKVAADVRKKFTKL